ncbi:hypothetical protein AB0M54_12035 [Actinoplanes sp. NPDC051470]|uniref:hypothetical protein n=1 Tax=unclassified Actinoplanes TaxID=2626549 RepID=UPI003425E3F0
MEDDSPSPALARPEPPLRPEARPEPRAVWPEPAWPAPPGAFTPAPPFEVVNPPASFAPPPARGVSRKAVGVSAGVLALAVAVSTGIIAFAPGRSEPSTAPVPAAEAGAKPPATPFEQAEASLQQQTAALLKGDQKGWLAAVDPKSRMLQSRYRTMFTSLRGLGVSQFEYHAYQRDGGKGTTVLMGVSAAFCLSRPTCPEFNSSSDTGPPRAEQALTLKPVGGRYVITSLSNIKEPNYLQPMPWESGDLVFERGRRVTVAATPKQAKNLKRVLAVAEKAAVINDRYAAFVGNPQQRYRVYLADDKVWKSWYGGIEDKWTVAYAVPLNNAGTDVVLRMSELSDKRLLETTVQHELGHVVTVGGVSTRDFGQDQWLSEGVAEYIGWAPRHAKDSWRRQGVRNAFRKARKPKTIAASALADDASDKAGDQFYGLAHFAIDCMAQTYGERKLFEFVKLTLREDNTYDMASREAYGLPFATVDKGCLTWIKKTA